MLRVRFAALAGLLPLLLLGCTGSRPLSSPAESLTEVNRVLTGETARIQFRGAEDYVRANAVTVTRDSVYYRKTSLFASSTDPGRSRQRSIHRVHTIAVEYGAGGGKNGLLLGAAPGVLLSGRALLALAERDCDSWCEAFSKTFLGVGLVGALVGGGIGTLVGNAIDDDAQVVYRHPVDRYLPDSADR